MDSITRDAHGVTLGRSPTPEFDKDAYRRAKLPRKLGDAIAGWDDPTMVPASRASHMRDDDYVIGLEFRGRARAYPLWIIDNYHVVNDRVDGHRFFVSSCERCQSGSAFVAEVPGSEEREPTFRTVGFLNATLVLMDGRVGSHWIHWEGVGLNRRARGVRLPWIPTYHMEWADWVELHPDTEVMASPDDPTHPDARHGHGREELFSRPGMDPAFLNSIVGPLDDTYPENEMVLVLEGSDGWLAFPLAEVQREGGVVRVDAFDAPVVVFAGPRPDGFTMSAFVPVAEGRELAFERTGAAFVDRETGSRWTIDGRSLEGPLAGARLEPVRNFYLRWHAVVYCHRGTRLFRSERPLPRWLPGAAPNEGFDPLLSALTERGHEISLVGPMVSQLRPHGTEASLTVLVDGDRIRLHRFESESAARDYEAFEGAWSTIPLRSRSLEARVRRLGRVVIQSDPEDRFAEPAQIVQRPFRSLRWASLLDAPSVDEIASLEPADRPAPPPGFLDIIHALRLSGFDVVDVGFLPPAQLRVGCRSGIALTIDAERFLLYRFATRAAASSYASKEPHARAVGPLVIRSTPDTMYHHQGFEILFVGDDRVKWSPLLDQAGLRAALRRVADRIA